MDHSLSIDSQPDDASEGLMMTVHPGKKATNQIWFSRILQSVDVIVGLRYSIERDGLEYKRDFQNFRPVDNTSAPAYLYFDRQTSTIPDDRGDAFKIYDGLLVVSQKLRDVLSSFDLGQTKLIEVPICLSDAKTVSSYPPHYILHVAETKECFVPEASEKVERQVWWGETEPRPDAPWIADPSSDVLAVRSSAAVGVDLWADPTLKERIFLSDRLKHAIDQAGVTQKGLEPVPATILD
ncbi:MAG: DUF1629 domain-containing protein [Pseudomonadota bacterium]